jgi:hypothetical protein
MRDLYFRGWSIGQSPCSITEIDVPEGGAPRPACRHGPAVLPDHSKARTLPISGHVGADARAAGG